MEINVIPDEYWSVYAQYEVVSNSGAVFYPALDAAHTTQELLNKWELNNICTQSAGSFLGIGNQIAGLTRNEIRHLLRVQREGIDYLSMTFGGLHNQRVMDFFVSAAKVLAVFRFGPEGEESSHAFGAIRYPKIPMSDGSYYNPNEFAVWDVGAEPPWFYTHVHTQELLKHIGVYYNKTPYFKAKPVELYAFH